MTGRREFLLSSLFLGAVALLLFANHRSGTRPADPQSMAEVRALVEKLGLNCRSDRQDGAVGFRLLISEAPLSLEKANLLRFSERELDLADWHGVVAAYHPLNFDSDLVVPWGKVVLYGDPALIQKLTGM
jgi:hypothetical protein